MSLRVRLSAPYLLNYAIACSAILLIAVVFPEIVLALQSDTTVVDKTGPVGAVVDKWWPLVVTFLTSTTLKVVSLFNKAVAGWPEPAQWTALYVIALLWNVFAKYAGIALVDPQTPIFALSFAEMGVAGLIYKWAGHKVPRAAEPVRGRGL
jgi:hypothetical protein